MYLSGDGRLHPLLGVTANNATHKTPHDDGRDLPIEDDCLPDPTMSFCPPHPEGREGQLEFMLLNNKVVSTDQTGRAALYNHDLPAFTVPKYTPVSLAVGDSLYVLEKIDPRGASQRRPQEEVAELRGSCSLVYADGPGLGLPRSPAASLRARPLPRRVLHGGLLLRRSRYPPVVTWCRLLLVALRVAPDGVLRRAPGLRRVLSGCCHARLQKVS